MTVSSVWIHVATYGGLILLAFVVAAIMAPIFYLVEQGNEDNWPLANMTVVKWECCRRTCGKSGCRYQPRWILRFFRDEGEPQNDSKAGGYTGWWETAFYGDTNVWYGTRSSAANAMGNHPIGQTFLAQYDPILYDEFRYVTLPGNFLTKPYLIWTIVMWSVAGAFCILPGIIYGLYKLFHNIGDCFDSSSSAKTPSKPTYTPSQPVTRPSYEYSSSSLSLSSFSGSDSVLDMERKKAPQPQMTVVPLPETVDAYGEAIPAPRVVEEPGMYEEPGQLEERPGQLEETPGQLEQQSGSFEEPMY